MPLIESPSDPDLVPEDDAEHREPIGALRLGAVAAVTVLAGYLLSATLLALATGTASGPEIGAGTLLAAAVPGWLAAHQVPLVVLGAPLSVLPFLPTAALGLLIAAITAAFLRRTGFDTARDAVRVIGAVAAGHAVLGAVLAALLSGAVDASVPGAFLRCGLVAAAGSAAGACRAGELPAAVRRLAGPTISAGLRGALLVQACLLVAGALVAVVALCLSAARAGEVLGRAGSVGDAFGLLLLSLLYLPNAALAGWSFAAGPGISVGGSTARFYETAPGAVPDVPLLAALPTGAAAWWWPVVLVLPVAAGAVVGLRCGRELDQARRPAAVAVAAAVASFGVLVVAALAGGSAGGGPFDPITLHSPALALVTFGWVLVPALPAVWLFPVPGRPVDEFAAELDGDGAGLDDEERAELDGADGIGLDGADDSDLDDEEPDGADEDADERDAADEPDDPDELDEELGEPADESGSGGPADAGPGFDFDEAEWADLVRRAQEAEEPDRARSWSGDIHGDADVPEPRPRDDASRAADDDADGPASR